MIIANRGRITFATMLALGFAGLLFQDLILFLLFSVVSILLIIELAWIRIVVFAPTKWFSTSGMPTMPQKLYVGNVSKINFTLLKKGAGSAVISSDLEFLKFAPNEIKGGKRETVIQAEFLTAFAGKYFSKQIKIRVTDPLRFFSADFSVPVDFKFVVLPKLLQVALTTSKILGKSGIGEIPIEKPGIGTEFYEIRPYQPGDESKRINWKATARRGELMVNEFSREVGAAYYLILDAVGSEYFEKDRLASTFLQIANSLALVGVRFGILVHDGSRVKTLKKIDFPAVSLQFALEVALEFTQVEHDEALTQELVSIPSFRMKTTKDTIMEQNYSTLGAILDIGFANVREKVRKNEIYQTILTLVTEGSSGEPPSVLYVTSMSGSVEQVLELGSGLHRVYNSDFVVVNPSAPWITAGSEDEAYDLYMKKTKKLKSLALAGIEYNVGNPIEIAQRLFAT